MNSAGKFLDKTSGDMAWKHGQSTAEIAAVLGCAESTVITILHRALKKLRAPAIKKRLQEVRYES